MRTKTLALSALLGLLGSASLMAQSTNVYSINAVGYVNVTLFPGYNIITCPLICSPDNTIATLLNNTNAQYQSGKGANTLRSQVYQMTGGIYTGNDVSDKTVTPSGWQGGGVVTMNPGQAIFFFNPEPLGTGSNMYATFVGTVPQATNGPLTNALNSGFNLIGSIVPEVGDLMTNAITNLSITSMTSTKFDYIYTYDPTYNSNSLAQNGYSSENQYTKSGWSYDTQLATVTTGFFYFNNNAASNYWVENFVINP
jgi:hypothetical protein